MLDKTSPNNGHGALAPWGSRDEVRELRERMAIMTPGAAKLSDKELAALAQGAIAHGLDPLNGEIWIIPGRGLMIGVKGLRKKAREQVRGNYWVDFQPLTNTEQRQALRIPDGALAYEARLFDSENLRQYSETCERLLKAGIPWEAVERMVGSKPYTVGLGVLKIGEQTKMEPAQCAMKRAEADALKRRFDVPFGIAIESDTEPEYDGKWVEVAQPPAPDETQAHPPVEAEINQAQPDNADLDAEIMRQEQRKAANKRTKAALEQTDN